MRALLFFLILGCAQAAAAVKVDVLHVRGVINAGTSRYIKRGIETAAADKAALLLLVLDTPGGLLNSTRDIVQGIDQSVVPVAVYVAPGGASATSAGTIITMSAHYAAMAPGTNIGAAHPVGGQGEDIKGTMKEKAENDTAAFIKAQAVLRGRNAEWAEQAIRKSVSATADEALKLHVVDYLAADQASLLAKLDEQPVHGTLAGASPKMAAPAVHLAGASLVELPMSLAESFLAFIGDPNVSYMLMTLGGLGIYVEVTSGGSVILPGVLGVISLILAFISFSTLPVSFGGVALLFVGFALFAIEPFVVSHGALTLGGVVSLLLGALILLDPSTGDLRLSLALVIPTVVAIGAMTFMAGYYALKARRTIYGGLTNFHDFEGVVQTVDDTGVSGKCLIRGETWDFELSHPQKPVHVGDHLSVYRRHGMKLIVNLKAK
ncbi:MAG: nodulation protein NfeD [Deltaproteobacteria bacterium]|nr:nodulation protein NfeD [Deltaproteobacteria bacterium]